MNSTIGVPVEEEAACIREASNPCCPLFRAKRQVCPCANGGSTGGGFDGGSCRNGGLDDGAVEIDLVDSRAAVESSAYKFENLKIFIKVLILHP